MATAPLDVCVNEQGACGSGWDTETTNIIMEFTESFFRDLESSDSGDSIMDESLLDSHSESSWLENSDCAPSNSSDVEFNTQPSLNKDASEGVTDGTYYNENIDPNKVRAIRESNTENHCKSSNCFQEYHENQCDVNYVCQRSGILTNDSASSILHSGRSTTEYKCDICGDVFPAEDRWDEHMLRHRERPYSCPKCDKSYLQPGHLKAHFRTHTGERPFACDSCNLRFVDKAGLNKHNKTHGQYRQYKCDTCEKVYRRKDHLKDHMLIHSGEHPYSCSKCCKVFTKLDNLNRHMRIHTGEKPYKCTLCAKSFTQQIHLTKHLRSHSGRKLFKCDLCELMFTTGGSLKAHKNEAHSKMKAFACSECDKCFSRPHSLASHMRLHTGEKPYECDTCKKRFRHNSSLKVHLKKH